MAYRIDSDDQAQEIRDLTDRVAELEKQLAEAKKANASENTLPISVVSERLLLDQLDKWVVASEKQAEAMRGAGMKEAAIGSEAMATAYWAVKQFVEVNAR